jgi:hypothetical protein
MPIQTSELDRIINDLLFEEQIYDPAGVGYEMWVQSPPYEQAFEAWQGNYPPNRAPTQHEQRLMELGTDFIALMKAARFAVGSTLLYRQEMQSTPIEPSPFEFHELSVWTTLSMAIDRLRDFIIRAAIDESPRRGHELDQLQLALCSARLVGVAEEVHEFESVMEDVTSIKKSRNDSVHEIALDYTRIQRKIMNDERDAHRRGKWKNPIRYDIPADEYQHAQEDSKQRSAAEVEGRIANLKESYHVVTKAGEVSFRLEYWLRRKSAS